MVKAEWTWTGPEGTEFQVHPGFSGKTKYMVVWVKDLHGEYDLPEHIPLPEFLEAAERYTRPKLREVLDECYRLAHYAIKDGLGQPPEVTEPEYEDALKAIESKIETLTDEDLGDA